MAPKYITNCCGLGFDNKWNIRCKIELLSITFGFDNTAKKGMIEITPAASTNAIMITKINTNNSLRLSRGVKIFQSCLKVLSTFIPIHFSSYRLGLE